MYHIVDTEKSFEEVSKDLEDSVKHHGFGVLHIYDLGNTLRKKGVVFFEECNIFEVCSPAQAAKVLEIDMKLNMALPCRISIFTEKGKIKVGFISPAQILSALSDDQTLAQIAIEVEEKLLLMIRDAA